MTLARSLFAAALVALLPLGALAETPVPEASATVKAATSIEKREPVGETTTFKAGALVFVWSEVKGALEANVEHVWKRDGKEFRRAHFHVGSQDWKMNSRMPNAAAGSYVVEVVVGEKKLGEIAFTVQ